MTQNQDYEENTFVDVERDITFLEKTDRILTGKKSIRVTNATHGLACACVKANKIYLNLEEIGNNSTDILDYFKKLKGLNYHELAHLLYTNERGVDGYLKEYHNILEDAMIENRFGLQYPKAFTYFRKTALDFIAKDTKNSDSFLLLYGRRLFIKKPIVDHFEALFVKKYGKKVTDETKRIIDAYIVETDLDKQYNLIKQLYELLNPKGAKPKSNSQPYSASSGNGKPTKAQAEQAKKVEQALEEKQELDKQAEETKGQEGEAQEGEAQEGNGQSQSITKQVEEEQEKIEKMLSETIESDDEKITNDTMQDLPFLKQEDVGCTAGDFQSQEFEAFHPKNEVKVVSKRLERVIKEWKNDTRATHLKKQKSGRLDIRQAIHSRNKATTRIFRNYKGSVQDKTRIAVAILLDESGSVEDYQYNIEISSAWALTQALENTGSKVTVYGFSSGKGSYSFDIHKKFESKGLWKRTRWGGTDPSHAIKHACELLRAYGRREKIDNLFLFVLTDGEYYMHESWLENHAQKHGINTVEILVGYTSFDNKGYDEKLVVPTFNELEGVMTKYIRDKQVEIVKKATKRY